MTTQTHIYEVVDATDDEHYYPLAVFLDEQEAMSALDGKEPPCDDNGGDSVTVEVRSRQIGWHPHDHKVIASRLWVREYEESGREWVAKEIVITK